MVVVVMPSPVPGFDSSDPQGFLELTAGLADRGPCRTVMLVGASGFHE